MTKHRKRARAIALVMACVCVVAGPFSTYAATSAKGFPASDPLQPIQFTPNIEELELTAVAATAMATGIATPGAIVDPAPGPAVATVTGDTMTIDGKDYPIGDTFTDAEDIPMGVIEDSLFHGQGYSTILAVGGEEHRLVWITDRGERQYMIVREDDPLFSGPDGFKESIEALGEAEDETFNAFKIELGGLGGIIAAEFAICPVTGAAGCVAAIVTAAGGLIGGAALTLWRVFTEYVPARENVGDAFEQIEINRPQP